MTSVISQRNANFRTYRWPLLKAAILVGALALPGALFSQGFVSSGAASASNANGGSSTAARAEKPVVEGRHIEARVHDGILTVDGLVAKVGLNYPVDAEFVYFFVPGAGTAIVSRDKFPNATPQKDAFDGKTLTVVANGHEIQLTNGGPLVKGKEEAWVAVDPNFATASRMPMMGYGETLSAPYQWPGAKPETTQSTALAPPVPRNLLPKMEVSSSYSVTVAPGTRVNP